jgi:hypothetical protein
LTLEAFINLVKIRRRPGVGVDEGGLGKHGLPIRCAAPMKE